MTCAAGADDQALGRRERRHARPDAGLHEHDVLPATPPRTSTSPRGARSSGTISGAITIGCGGPIWLTHTLVYSTTGPRDGRAGGHRGGERRARIMETDAGAVIRGARMLATLAPFADELAVVPSISRFPPDTEEGRPVAFAFCIPMATPGLRFIAASHSRRRGRAPRLSAVRPHGRDGLRGRLRRRARTLGALLHLPQSAPRRRHHGGGPGHTLVQSAIKDLAKSEFLLGLAYNLGVDQRAAVPNVQNNIGEMITVTEMVRAAVLAAESDPVPGPAGTLVPTALPRPGALLLPESFPRLLEIVRILGAGGLMMAVRCRRA